MWGKQKDKGIKGLVSCMLVWPCPAPDQCSLSCLLIKSLTLLLDELCSIQYRGDGES